MVKKFITTDEWYPVYTLENKSYYKEIPVDVDDEFIERVDRVFGLFYDIQDELGKLYDVQRRQTYG